MHKKLFGKGGAMLLAAAMTFNMSVVSASVVTADNETRYEFEDAVITGEVTVESNANASGGSCLKMTESGTINIDFEVESDGMYDLTIYAGGLGSAKQQTLLINGNGMGSLDIPKNDTGFDAITVTAKLSKGKNTLTIEKSWGWSSFDYFTVASAELAAITATDITPCDINATAETRSLMNYLSQVYGKHIISGQQEIYNYGHGGDFEVEFDYLEELTGKLPAIRGFDFLNCANILYGSEDGTVDRMIDWATKRNGIVTAAWHITVPKKMEGYKVGDYVAYEQATYKPDETNFITENILKEGTVEREFYLKSLENIAPQLQRLQEAGVPVIWRPLHEAEGNGGESEGWFWWASGGSAVYKDIWKLTYDTLVNEYDLHNLIWEWNSYNFTTSPNWYPGDEYVDIIAYDKYSGNTSAATSVFRGLMEKYDSAKMVAMAENDSFSTVENLTSEQAGWLYFCTWYDGGGDYNFLSDPKYNTKENTIEMYQSDYCITLDELPADLYKRNIAPVDPSKTTTKTPKPTTTTTTTTTAPVPAGKEPAKISVNGEGVTTVKLPRPADTIYMNVELPKEVTYANGCLGASVAIGEKYYWVNMQWETTKSGLIKFAPAENIYNITLPDDDTNYAEDENINAEVKKILAETTNFQWQKWYAQNAAEESIPTDDIKLLGVYIDSEVPTPDLIWGDANCDGEVRLDDAILVLQAIGNPEKYGVNGSDETHITEHGMQNADVFEYGSGLSSQDALQIQKYTLQLINSLNPDEL